MRRMFIRWKTFGLRQMVTVTVPLEWTFDTLKGPLHLALSLTPVGSSNITSIFGVYVKGRRRLFPGSCSVEYEAAFYYGLFPSWLRKRLVESCRAGIQKRRVKLSLLC